MMDYRTFFAACLRAHEGGLSLLAADNGNWFDRARYRAGQSQQRGCGVLIGSKYGVTAAALAAYRHCDTIAPWEMAALAFDEAVDIAVQLYVRAPGLDRLPVDRVMLSVIDKGWGSGPAQAVKLLQREIGALPVDGKVGPATVAAYKAWRARLGEDAAARRWAAIRHAFDAAIAANDGPNDPDRAFLRGWNNRTDSFLPGTPWWRAAA